MSKSAKIHPTGVESEMKTTNDGGPGFPGESPDEQKGVTIVSGGMSLRDWFAGMALAGNLANPAIEFTHDTATAAKWAYQYADAMLAQREK